VGEILASVFDYLLLNTTGDVHLWSLPNVKGEGRERWIGTRIDTKIDTFIAKRDEAGYGTFFCVSTIEHNCPRKKEFAQGLPWLFCDTDFKNIDLEPDEIERRIRALDCVPTRMHHTGNGIHNFWVLNVPVDCTDQQLRDAAEVLLRKLALALGSDPLVAHCVALLRVPGTHNSKRGEWREVRVIREGREVYTLDQIGAWLASLRDPVMVSRSRQLNPFERIAHEQGFRPPIDVEERLANMIVGGDGDAGVHATQLSCTASLLATGVDEEDAVIMVLDATKELAGTEGWDWVVEERNIRGMCADWAKKHPQRATLHDITPALEQMSHQAQEGGKLLNEPPAEIVSLSDARKDRDDDREERKERVREKLKKKHEHVYLGQGILEELELDHQRVVYNQNQFWLCKAGIWKALSMDEEKTWINVSVERGSRAAKMVSNTKVVNETRAWLQRNPDLHHEVLPWDAHGKVATRSGLIDWCTGTMEPLHPDQYVSRVVECQYIPSATCPTWETMLAEDYQFDDDTISFLQECAGAALLVEKPRGLRRALVMLGPSNTGKSNILNVLAGLVGSEQNPTSLQALEHSHGLMMFLKPHPWVLHEAFEQSRWEMSSNVKALLSGDILHVNVKNGPLLPLTFKQPIFWGTNVPPQFREASRAMENRLAIVEMHRAFDPLRVSGTARLAMEQGYANPAELVLNQEKAGLLNWALVGLKRGMARGHFVFTRDMNRSLHSMRVESNMATGFIEDCCEHDPDSYVTTGDFYGAFSVWWRDHRGGTVPSSDQLGRAMSSLSDPRVLTGMRISHKRTYCGLKLVGEGLDCWNAFAASVAAERTGQVISNSDADVNKVFGPEQLQRAEIISMMDYHRTWRPERQDE